MARPNFYKHHADGDIDLDNVKGDVPLVLVPVAPLAALQHGRIGQDEALEAIYRAAVEAHNPDFDATRNIPEFFKDHPLEWRRSVEGSRKSLENLRQKSLIGNACAKGEKGNTIKDSDVHPSPVGKKAMNIYEGENRNEGEEEENYPIDGNKFEIMFSKCEQGELDPVSLAMAVCGSKEKDNRKAWGKELNTLGRGEFLNRVRVAYEQMEKENRRPLPSYMQMVLRDGKPQGLRRPACEVRVYGNPSVGDFTLY